MMSSKRKSHRNKKNVDYADNKLNYESDDEFEPPSKKVKTKTVLVKDVVKREKSERKSPTQRLSVDEKLYQRDVEKALKISLSSSASNNEEENDVVEINKAKKLTTLEDSDYEPEDETTGYESDEDNCDEEKENASDFSDDEIKKKTITKGKKTNNRQSIGNNKKSVTSVIPERENQISFLSETSADQTKTISGNKKPVLPGKRSSPSPGGIRTTPVVNRNLSSLGLGGVKIKNPGPPIRVGLSRNMKVKPLHSKVSVPH